MGAELISWKTMPRRRFDYVPGRSGPGARVSEDWTVLTIQVDWVRMFAGREP
jgi:hypothetical protein